MNVPYELWPIWADYLEEQGFDTEFLRYYLTWGTHTFFTYPYHLYLGYYVSYSHHSLIDGNGCKFFFLNQDVEGSGILTSQWRVEDNKGNSCLTGVKECP